MSARIPHSETRQRAVSLRGNCVYQRIIGAKEEIFIRPDISFRGHKKSFREKILDWEEI